MTPVSARRIADNGTDATWGVRVSIGRYTFVLTEKEATDLADKIITALGVDE